VLMISPLNLQEMPVLEWLVQQLSNNFTLLLKLKK
jgi:hypothetical protein